MEKAANVFPLNFDAPNWSTEQAVPHIFRADLCSSPPSQNWLNQGKSLVDCISSNFGNVAPNKPNKNECEALCVHFKKYFAQFNGSSLSPIMWCRLAIQYWLLYGRRQKTFIDAMTRWEKTESKNGAAKVVYLSKGVRREISWNTFLFGKTKASILITGKAEYKTLSYATKPQNKATTKPNVSRPAASRIGEPLLNAVRNAVQELFDANQTRKKRFNGKRTTPQGEKFLFIGRRNDLYNAITHGNTALGRYSKDSVLKAISVVAICR